MKAHLFSWAFFVGKMLISNTLLAGFFGIRGIYLNLEKLHTFPEINYPMIRATFRYLLIFILFAFPVSLVAQANIQPGPKFTDGWFIGLSTGPTFFSGDLNTNRFLPQSGDLTFSGAFHFGRQLSHVFALRGQVLYGKLKGKKTTKEDGTPVNLSFSAPIVDGNINTMINFSNLIGGFNPKRAFFVYGTVGIGVFYWKTTQHNLLTGAVVPNIASSGNVSAVIPVGLGAYYSIANKVNIGLEYTCRTITSDMVDGIAEGFKMDIYSLLSLNVTLNLSKATRKAPVVIDYKKEGPIVLNLPKCNPITPMPKADMGMERLPPPPPVTGINLDQFYLFKVQIFAFAQRIYSPETIRKRYHIPMPVSREYSDGLYRFTVGSTESIGEAKEILQRMINAGVSDAFIVGYTKDGQRVSLRDIKF